MPELPVPEAFEWTSESWGPALRCTPLGRVAPHLFSTRGLPLPQAASRDGSGWAAIARSLGVAGDAVIRLRQVHGVAVIVVRPGAPLPEGEPPEADVVLTDRPGVALTVRVADCNPILFGDRRTGAVAATHAGWRGTAAGAAPATVRAMARAFGSHAADLIVAVGPSIGPCCYEVGLEVRDAFANGGAGAQDLARWFLDQPGPRRDAGGPEEEPGLGASDFRLPRPEQLRGFRRQGASARVYADLWTATVDQLVSVGVPAGQVHVAGLCTACHRGLFHSYRAEGTAGRTAGAIAMAPR